MLQVARFDSANLQRYQAYGGQYTTWEDLKFDDPTCVAAFTEKRKGDDLSAPWHFWNDEVWYILQGELKLEWTSPPMFNEEQSAIVRPGDLIKVPMGVSVKATVLSDEPVRLLWVAMPRPRYFGASAFSSGAAEGAEVARDRPAG